MGGRLALWILLGVFLSLAVSLEAKAFDPYKVLGVERNANQREIQKAFHKLSLQYHPDKNKNKGAQEKFAEINNAYEILGDEERRKNYDLYGDEKGNPSFDAGHPGGQEGYTYFTNGNEAQNGFNFRPGNWQNMGEQGSSKSFSFSFGGPSSESPFGFGMDDIFNMFGGAGGGGFSGFGGGFSRSQHSSQFGPASSPKSLKDVKPQSFKKEVVEQGITWLLLAYTPSLRGIQNYESVVQEIADSLQGALKVGGINCESEASFCRGLGIQPYRTPRLFVYSYKVNEKGSLVEYKGHLVAKNLKSFCQDHFPRFSKRVDLQTFNSFSGKTETLPRVLLLSTKKDTPVIWRVLSGLYHKRFTFNDVQVQDVSDPLVKKLAVDALPALVGWLSNGEKHILKSGIAVKDLESAVHDLGALLDGFDKKNKKAASSRDGKAASGSAENIPLLTQQNFDTLCGEADPVCIIGTFRSSKAREKLESVLSSVSQKSFTRRSVSGFGDSVSYALLDATKHPTFLSAFEKSGFKTSDKVLLAYKPRKSKFATLEGDTTMEDAERFIGYVLSGDVQFKKTRQKPVMK